MPKSSEEEQGSGVLAIPTGVDCELGDFFSFGDLIATFRMCDEMDQREFSTKLGVSESYLRDVEARRVVVGPAEAAAWARVVGYPATEFVRRLLQDLLDEAEVDMCVSVQAF